MGSIGVLSLARGCRAVIWSSANVGGRKAQLAWSGRVAPAGWAQLARPEFCCHLSPSMPLMSGDHVLAKANRLQTGAHGSSPVLRPADHLGRGRHCIENSPAGHSRPFRMHTTHVRVTSHYKAPTAPISQRENVQMCYCKAGTAAGLPLPPPPDPCYEIMTKPHEVPQRARRASAVRVRDREAHHRGQAHGHEAIPGRDGHRVALRDAHLGAQNAR